MRTSRKSTALPLRPLSLPFSSTTSRSVAEVFNPLVCFAGYGSNEL
ncbi:MAG: hypothetical protein ACKESB_02730 [Candidatus Hodgkinia cicadicola]